MATLVNLSPFFPNMINPPLFLYSFILQLIHTPNILSKSVWLNALHVVFHNGIAPHHLFLSKRHRPSILGIELCQLRKLDILDSDCCILCTYFIAHSLETFYRHLARRLINYYTTKITILQHLCKRLTFFNLEILDF